MVDPRLRALHCSDLHLHGTHAEHALATVRALRAAAERHAADLVLLAGDLFDAPAQPDSLIEALAAELARLPVPLVAIPGNHDIGAGNVGHAADAIVRLFALLDERATLLAAPGGETAIVADGRARVWGRGMPEHSPANNPLEGLRAMPEDGRWNVVIAHGQLTELGGEGRSSPIALERHAEVLRGVHYLALGHRHTPTEHQLAGTTVRYSGSASNLVGRGTFAITEFDGVRTTVAIERLAVPHAGLS